MKIRALIICLALLASSLFAQQVEDTIKWRDANRPPQNCAIKDETYAQIKFTIKASNAAQSDNMDAVQEITWGRKPPRLENAEGAEKRGDYKEAIQWYRKLADDVKGKQQPQNFLQYALYGEAKDLKALKKYDDAINAFNDLKSNIPETKFLRDIYMGLYDCYIQKSDQPNAEKAINDMWNFAIQKGLESWKADVAVLKAGNLEAKNNYNGAIGIYIEIQKNKNISDSTRDSAIAGEMRCLAGLKDYAKLAKRSKELMESPSPAILASAYTYLGEATLQDKDYKSATDLFLHTVLLYRDYDYKTTARAYYGAIVSIVGLASQSSQKDEYKQRAQELCNELATYDRGLAGKAQETINSIK